MHQGTQDTQEIRKRALPFLAAHGFGVEPVIEPVRGGGNNRVYRVDSEGRSAVLKAYFISASDQRDRFGAERAFYTLVSKNQIQHTPAPIAWDATERFGLLSFVEGRKLTAAEIGAPEIGQATDFIRNLNQSRSDAPEIPNASEACFTVAEHLACVDRRIARLQRIEAHSEVDRAAADFVHVELLPAWTEVRSGIFRKCSSQSMPIDHPLDQDARCLSPSDFGFHNALMTPSGALRFFDFEYAGWDDPAKLICDFFCQPQVPVAFGFWDLFVRGLESGNVMDATARLRADILFPAYRVKWCCILLNEFVASDRARRDFASGAPVATDRKAAQLQRARLALASMIPLP